MATGSDWPRSCGDGSLQMMMMGTGASGDACAAAPTASPRTASPAPVATAPSTAQRHLRRRQHLPDRRRRAVLPQDCAARTDCRDGYMCFHGACQPSCTDNVQCGTGFMCTDGACIEIVIIGKKNIGEACMTDDDCASALCDLNSVTCRRGCLSDEGCNANETCYLNAIDTNNDTSKDAIRPICIARHFGGAVPGAACQARSGLPARLLSARHLHQPVRVERSVRLDDELPDHGDTLDVGGPHQDLHPAHGHDHRQSRHPRHGPAGRPGNVQGMNIFTSSPTRTSTFFTGLADLTAPDGTVYYTVPRPPPTTTPTRCVTSRTSAPRWCSCPTGRRRS